MDCGLDKQKRLLEVASATFSRHRKLMRHQLGQHSHFLRLAGELHNTIDQLQQAADESGGQSVIQASALADAQEQLSQVAARVEQLGAAQAEHESVVKHAEHEMSRIKVTLCHPAPDRCIGGAEPTLQQAGASA